MTRFDPYAFLRSLGDARDRRADKERYYKECARECADKQEAERLLAVAASYTREVLLLIQIMAAVDLAITEDS